MTYLGRGREGRGSHLLLTTLPLIPLFRSQTCPHSTAAFPLCTGGMWGNNPLQSTPLSLPLSEEKEYICPDPAHICLIPLCWQTLFAHAGMLRLAKVGLLNMDWKQRFMCMFQWTCHTTEQTSNMATCVSGWLVCLLYRLLNKHKNAFWAVSMRASCSGLVCFRGFSSPCGNKQHVLLFPMRISSYSLIFPHFTHRYLFKRDPVLLNYIVIILSNLKKSSIAITLYFLVFLLLLSLL